MSNQFSIKTMLIISLGVLGLCSTAHSLKPVELGEQTRKSNTMPIYNKSTGESYIPSDDAMGLGVSLSGRFMALKIYDRTLNIDLPIYVYKGEHWFAGIPGNEYSLHLYHYDHIPKSIAAITVDSINIKTGQVSQDMSKDKFIQSSYLLSGNVPSVISVGRNKNSRMEDFTFLSVTKTQQNLGISVLLYDEILKLDPMPNAILAAIPKQVIMLRYDSPENLVRRGILSLVHFHL